MGINLPTYGRNETSVTAREAEVTNADFDGGMNLGASNAPGIGINTGDWQQWGEKDERWTLLDQAAAARDPQDSQHIGGDGLGDGDATVTPIQAVQGADVNDTLSLVTAAQDTAPDAGLEAGGTGTVNRTGKTVPTGAIVWGTDTVV